MDEQDMTAADLAAVRKALGSGLSGPISMSAAADAAGVSRHTWGQWERDKPRGQCRQVVQLLCIRQGLIGPEDDFRAWLDGLKGRGAS